MPRPFSAPPRRETLAYQNQALHYTLVFRSRRTIGFAVRPDGSVHISAPAGTSPEWVAQQVLKKADWILKHQQAFASRPAPAPTRHYEAGSPHYYQGRSYPLRFAEAARPAVAVSGDELVIFAPSALDTAQTEALLHAWYARQASPLFAASLARVWPRFAEFNLRQAPRWPCARCAPAGAAARRARPAFASRPSWCAPAPSASTTCCCTSAATCWWATTPPAFYTLQTRLLPDWQHWKQELNALPK